MKEFFSNFPIINYNDEDARNLILKSAILKEVMDSKMSYYPYTIRGDERADMVAYNYYGSKDLVWVVYMSNYVVDPYYEWPMTQADFYKYIVSKYGAIETAQETILHYKYNPNVDSNDIFKLYTEGYKMAPETYNALTVEEKSFWTAVDAFTYEDELNESRRSIELLDNELVPQLLLEIESIYK